MNLQTEKKYVWKDWDWIWFLYFSVMFNFYTYTYVQLFSQLAIIAYTVLECIRNNGKVQIKTLQRAAMYCLWYGLFAAICYFSKYWCYYPPRSDSNTTLTVVRIFAIGLCITLSLNNIVKISRMIYVFLHAGVLFVLLSFMTNPLSHWGHEQFVSFASGYMRNSIANYSMLMFLILYLWKDIIGGIRRNLFMLVFLAAILVCGSRRALIQLVLGISVSVLLEKNISKKVRYIFIGVLIAGAMLLIAENIPFLKETYITRIEQMLMGVESSDSSTVGRSAYIMLAMNLFKERPILGWGVDGFYNFLLHNPYAFRDNMRLKALYSHNNFTEILSCFGLIGFVIYYRMHIKILIDNLKYCRSEVLAKGLVVLMVVELIGDYGGIAFSYHIAVYLLVILFCLNSILNAKRINRE